MKEESGSTASAIILEGQKHALELALHGAPLQTVLEVLVRALERQSQNDVIASILLTDHEGKHLLLGAAPSLPDPYNEAIHGISIGPTVGSCGTAAYTKQTVVVRDIQTDPLWAAFKGLAAEHGLRACWSTPIMSSQGAVLGTFALYHRLPSEPSARDLGMVELISKTAGVIIERDLNGRLRERAEKRLRAQYELSNTLMSASSLEAAAPRALAAVAGCLGWEFAALWRLDAARSTLEPLSHWSSYPLTEEALAELVPPAGVSLDADRIVAATAQARTLVWHASLAAHGESATRCSAPLAAGFSEACALPVVTHGEVTYVVEVLGRTRYAHDEADERVLSSLVSAMSQWLERLQAEDEVRRLLAERDAAFRRAEAERRKLYELFDNAPASISFVRASDHVIEFANKMHRRVTGRTVEGKSLREAFSDIPNVDEFVSLFDRVVETGEPYVGNEVRVPLDRHGTGEVEDCYFSFVYQPTLDANGKVDGILNHSVEVTEQVLARRELAQHNETLERKVDERTSELRAANHELESFSYSVSHDLRAPVRHIAGFVQLLERRASESLDDKGRHYLKTIGQSADTMGRLIDALLEFSRLGRNELVKHAVDANALTSDVLNALQPEAANRNVSWIVHPLPWVMGDATMLRSVFANLLGNALKYTRTRAEARIELGVRTEPGTDEATFYVTDNGVGFQMEYADKLFGVFQRLHTDQAFEGTGIGLAMVRRIVSRHGGKVWAQGKPNEGAAFYFTLPVARST